jgi:hypothetical protein
MFAPTVPIWVKVVLSSERSTWKAVSLVELSVQLRLIWLDDAAVAVRPLGAAGVGVALGVGVGEGVGVGFPLSES